MHTTQGPASRDGPLEPEDSSVVLTRLLTEHSVGTGRITPRPRGARLAGEHRSQIEEVLDTLEESPGFTPTVVFGNGCYATGRYGDAVRCFIAVLGQEYKPK